MSEQWTITGKLVNYGARCETCWSRLGGECRDCADGISFVVGTAVERASTASSVGTSGASEPKTSAPILQALDTGTNRGGGTSV